MVFAPDGLLKKWRHSPFLGKRRLLSRSRRPQAAIETVILLLILWMLDTFEQFLVIIVVEQAEVRESLRGNVESPIARLPAVTVVTELGYISCRCSPLQDLVSILFLVFLVEPKKEMHHQLCRRVLLHFVFLEATSSLGPDV